MPFFLQGKSSWIKLFTNWRTDRPSQFRFYLSRQPDIIDTLCTCFFLLVQLAHGADPTMKNQEGQTPLDLATVSTLQMSSDFHHHYHENKKIKKNK